MYDIAIIGAGVVGGMIARKLSSKNLSICILEKNNDVAMGASRANSGIVHAGFDAKEGTLKAKFNVEGSKMMKQIAEDLGVKYKNNGAMVIGFTDEDRKTIEELYERGIKNGVQGLEILNKEQIKEKEKNISDEVNCALYAPTSAIICPYELTIASIGNAMDNGAELKLNYLVKDIEYKDSIYYIKSENEVVEAKYVINCAGIFADEIAKMVGDNSFNIHARKGEYLLLDKDCKNLVTSTIFRTPTKLGKGILISPTVDENIILGPTSEDIKEKDEVTNSLEGLEKIINKANENINNIPFGKIITSFAGLRSVGDTGDFIINSNVKNFINVAGIESPGLSSAPAIAEYVYNMLEKMGLSMTDKAGYIKTRKPYSEFKKMSIEDKNELIKKDSRYGKIICRCEEVTEGEIVNAIKQNPGATDIDGIKRRTRSGMGRCQGGFCLPYIVKILSRELAKNYEDITKFGGESYINYEKTKGGNNI